MSQGPKVTHDIGAKLWSLCHVLRDDGVTYHQYLSELTYLLFLKMLAETGKEDLLPEDCRWAQLTSREGDALLVPIPLHRWRLWSRASWWSGGAWMLAWRPLSVRCWAASV